MNILDNDTFYPTPDNIIDKMLLGLNMYSSGCTILEPSAGKGNIIDKIQKKGCKNIYAIERDLMLIDILLSKDIKVISNDFLKYQKDISFDYIIMNPPFDKGDEHLLKAWDILEEGEIRCLLNKETISNPYSKKRKILLDIIKNNGTIEDLGSCFKESERFTNVEVVLVSLKKEGQQKDDNMFNNFKKSDLNFEGIEQNFLVKHDIIQNLIESKELLQQKTKQLVELRTEIEAITKYIFTDYNDFAKVLNTISYSDKKSQRNGYNKLLETIKKECWNNVFTKTKVSKFITNQTNEKLARILRYIDNLEFNKENIINLFNTILLNKDNFMIESIKKIFQTLTTYYKGNKVYVEGWKTNDYFKVNRKIILPNMITSFSTRNQNVLYDLDKCLCFITGNSYETNYNIADALRDKKNESSFFTIKTFKKGTLHLKFKDEQLYEKFNLIACEGENKLK